MEELERNPPAQDAARTEAELTNLHDLLDEVIAQQRREAQIDLLLVCAAILTLTAIAFFLFTGFRRSVLQAVGRVRDGVSQAVSPRRLEPGGPVSGTARARRIRIGRGRRMDVRLDSRKVSRFHAELTTGDEGCRLADRGSTNGTSVLRDGRWQRIRQEVVGPDERLRLGDFDTTAAQLLLWAGAAPPAGGGEKPTGGVPQVGGGEELPGAAPPASGGRPVDDRPIGPVKRNRRTGEVVPDQRPRDQHR